jgi:hypothetical protein
MTVQRRVVETFETSDGRTFTSFVEAEAHENTLAEIKVFRAFANEYQEGKSEKAAQMVVNVLVAYHKWLSETEKAPPIEQAA